MGNYSHGDGVLLSRLALLGRFVEVPEALFFPRQHEEQSMRMIGDHLSYAEWFDPSLKGKALFPNWRIFWEFYKSPMRAALSLGDRLRCIVAVGRQNIVHRERLVRDIRNHLRRR